MDNNTIIYRWGGYDQVSEWRIKKITPQTFFLENMKNSLNTRRLRKDEMNRSDWRGTIWTSDPDLIIGALKNDIGKTQDTLAKLEAELVRFTIERKKP